MTSPGSGLRPVSGPTPEVVAALTDWLAATDEPEPLVVETSGSTGRPKRVVLGRRALVASATATATVLGAQGRWLLALPTSYVAGLQVVVRSLLAGAPPVIGEDHETFEKAVDALLDGSGDAQPGFCSLVPTQLVRLLDDPDDTAALARLHTVLLGGGPIDPALKARAEAAGVRVVATYGASETSGGCVYDGLPLPGVRVELEEGPDGSRILLGGVTLADGYLDDSALSAETFVDGWYRTADAGRWLEDPVSPGGRRLQVLGRLDDVVVSGGVNVPAPAVAARLREHPGVREAEVVGVGDPEWGSRVVALVVPATRAPLRPPSTEQLRDFVGAVMPRAWAPRTVRHVDALPMLTTGKVDRLALIALAEQS